MAPARREEDKSPKDRGGGCHQGLHDCEKVFTQEARKDQELWARFLMDEDMGLANTPQIYDSPPSSHKSFTSHAAGCKEMSDSGLW